MALPPESEAQRHESHVQWCKSQRAKAPEVVQLRIIESIQREPLPGTLPYSVVVQVELRATIDQVLRTASGLSHGQEIWIVYERSHQMCPGPATYNAPILDVLDTTYAYLREASSGVYELAADTGSFTRESPDVC